MDFASLRAFIYRSSYPIAKLSWFVRRPHIRAAACIITRDNEVLLIRHTYGNRNHWSIPGGLINWGENAEVAAMREASEEVGLTLDGLRFVGVYNFIDNYKFVELTVYSGTDTDGVIELDRGELAAAHWFSLDELPPLAKGTKLALVGRRAEML